MNILWSAPKFHQRPYLTYCTVHCKNCQQYFFENFLAIKILRTSLILEKKTLSLICFYKVYNFSHSNDHCWLILRNILEGYKKQKFETIIYIFVDTTFSRCTMFGIFLFKFCYISVLVRYIRNYRCSENRNRRPTKNSLFTWKIF